MRGLQSRSLLAALALALSAVPSGHARVSRLRLPSFEFVDRSTGNSSATSFLATADGALHILYPGTGLSLRHAWRRGGEWGDEVVDPRYSTCGLQPTAVDSLGRIHAAYVVEDPAYRETHVVTHAVRGALGWTLTPIATGYFPVLYLGLDSLPRIVFQGPERMKVATFDGAKWTTGDFGPAPPDSIRPIQIFQDAAGHLHALDDIGYGVSGFYATDATGPWVRSAVRGWSLALDPEGHPHLADSESKGGIEEGWDRLVQRWHDGTGWRSEVVLEGGKPFRIREDARMVADAAGRLSMAYFQEDPFPDDRTATIRFAYRDGTGWREFPLGRAGVVFPMPPFVASDGSIHVIWYDRHARVALPDLAADGSGVKITTPGDGVRVAGALVVRNRGPGRSRSAPVRFFLSDDDVLDEGDELLGGGRLVGSLAPGGEARIPVAFRIPGPVAGRRLLAVVDPAARLHDLDRPDNTAAIPLGE